jgi:hypothetical protein
VPELRTAQDVRALASAPVLLVIHDIRSQVHDANGVKIDLRDEASTRRSVARAGGLRAPLT